MVCGWVKNHRKMTEWEWYKKPFMYHLFSHLILMANHDDGFWQGVEVKRGQLITGRNSLRNQTGIAEQSIRTCLRRLETSGEITQKSTNKFTIITICNYDRYQDKQPTINQQLTSNQPTTNHKQECKEEKEEKICANEAYRFADFWKSYPKKKDKAKAEKAWRRVKPNDALIDSILLAVVSYSKTEDWTKENGKYIPLPTSFINGKRWEDEIETSQESEWA